nr:UBN2 domain-containing protein [Tanacetum cinerariifolium]
MEGWDWSPRIQERTGKIAIPRCLEEVEKEMDFLEQKGVQTKFIPVELINQTVHVMNQSFNTLNKEKKARYSEADWKTQVGAGFISKRDNEVPFEFKTEEQAADELDRGVNNRIKAWFTELQVCAFRLLLDANEASNFDDEEELQGNKQVKDNKIDLFVQKYKEFVIFDNETTDCAFARFNSIITSLKVYEVVLEKDSEASKVKKENYKSLALKARKVSSDEDESCLGSDE